MLGRRESGGKGKRRAKGQVKHDINFFTNREKEKQFCQTGKQR
jgi:hypothetical protein